MPAEASASAHAEEPEAQPRRTYTQSEIFKELSAKEKWAYTEAKIRTIQDLPFRLRDVFRKVIEKNDVIKKHREFEIQVQQIEKIRTVYKLRA